MRQDADSARRMRALTMMVIACDGIVGREQADGAREVDLPSGVPSLLVVVLELRHAVDVDVDADRVDVLRQRQVGLDHEDELPGRLGRAALSDERRDAGDEREAAADEARPHRRPPPWTPCTPWK